MRRLAITSVLLAGVGVLAGGTCSAPLLLDLRDRTLNPAPETLGIAISMPSTNRTVTQGTIIPIEWSAANLTDEDAIVTILVRGDADLGETILEGGLRVSGPSIMRTTNWDTSGFPSTRYLVRARIETATLTRRNDANGRITVDEPPRFEFRAPADPVTFRFDPDAAADDGNGDGTTATAKGKTSLQMQEQEQPEPDVVSSITFRWDGFDREGAGATAEITLDNDEDPDSGNEIVLRNTQLVSAGGVDSYTFRGRDETDALVPAGTYRYFARVQDSFSEPRVVDGLATIVVLEPPEATDDVAGPPTVTAPAEDTEFLASASPLKVEFTLDEPADVLVDLKIDTDDNHTNGNELTILSQRLIASDVDMDSFDWNGTDSAGAAVSDGIYRVFIEVYRDAGQPARAQAAGLVFRRGEANKPLIALLEPATSQTLMPGDNLIVRWRDDDPSETATIRLTIDDDPNPAEAVETGAAEIEILAGRSAKDDGVSDTFQAFKIPTTLPFGTYFVFAYIDRDGAAPFEHHSVAPGRIIVPDPANP